MIPLNQKIAPQIREYWDKSKDSRQNTQRPAERTVHPTVLCRPQKRIPIPLCLVFVQLMLWNGPFSQTAQIDRSALVHRHLPVCKQMDPLSPFTVGNGEFALTADVTGLQTFPKLYESGIPLVTQSQWGWHTEPNVLGYRYEQTIESFDTDGRPVPYASIMDSPSAKYFRANPHRLHLGQIGFKKRQNQNFTNLLPEDIEKIDQILDIWEGVLKSVFLFEGQQIQVGTCVHPEQDQVAVRIKSSSLNKSPLAIGFDFPYPSQLWGIPVADWQQPEKHQTRMVRQDNQSVFIERQLDSFSYFVHIRWQGEGDFFQLLHHSYILEIRAENLFEFFCTFSRVEVQEDNPVRYPEPFKTTRDWWKTFWNSGGAIDLSKSRHPQAFELERRIVLSQYLTAIQCSGSLPPQETGLTGNSWFGKFHLEMHWWHAVHFALWGRPEMLEKSLGWYRSILPAARDKAQKQGYAGVRWPKMTSPDGIDSPSSIGVFLIWQQPHPIYFAELLYRDRENPEILQKYKDLVFQTADFMASYAIWDDLNSRYTLGPPLIPAQEIYPPSETKNPAFELAYWKWGLKTARTWRLRLGLPVDPKWEQVIRNLSPIPVSGGRYQSAETAMNPFLDIKHCHDHPTVLGILGMLPNEAVDVEVMARTLEQVLTDWNWESTWGWDYPLIAMCAARIGRPDLAIKALLMKTPKNRYLNNGHNFQTDQLPVYLPGNGGLLTAAAMMVAGWDGGPDREAPGFPKDGQWIVDFKGFSRFP